MNKRLLSVFAFQLSWLLSVSAYGGGSLGDTFEVYLPQVASGRGALVIDTRIVVTNAGTESNHLRLSSSDPELLPTSEFDLAAGETRTLDLSSDDLRVGWVRIASGGPVAAFAILTTREPEDGSIVSQASILAQPAATKFAVPVLRDSALGQETGLAVADPAGVDVTLSLLNADGQEVASRVMQHRTGVEEGDFSDHFSMYLADLFTDLPDGFASGSLIVSGPQFLPRTVAVAALYTRGRDLFAAPVASVDLAGDYLLELEPVEDVEAVVEALAQQYGFTVVEPVTPSITLIRTEDERARAVSRDPRVRTVEPQVFIP